MRSLLDKGITRVAGASSQDVFKLKQAMGGGTTHLLVGFDLLARNPELRKRYGGGTLYGQSLGQNKSGIFKGEPVASVRQESIKKAVKDREIRLVVATAAPCEGLNLQTLGTLIHVDLPWNPSGEAGRGGGARVLVTTNGEGVGDLGIEGKLDIWGLG